MTEWIFQSKPSQYDIVEEFEEGKEVDWYATRYRKEMQVGDRVFFWSSGDSSRRGIYGEGVIVNEPEPNHASGTPRVRVRFERKLNGHISAGQLKKNEALRDMQILRIPIGSNFKLNEVEASAVSEAFSSFSDPEET